MPHQTWHRLDKRRFPAEFRLQQTVHAIGNVVVNAKRLSTGWSLPRKRHGDGV